MRLNGLSARTMKEDTEIPWNLYSCIKYWNELEANDLVWISKAWMGQLLRRSKESKALTCMSLLYNLYLSLENFRPCTYRNITPPQSKYEFIDVDPHNTLVVCSTFWSHVKISRRHDNVRGKCRKLIDKKNISDATLYFLQFGPPVVGIFPCSLSLSWLEPLTTAWRRGSHDG